MTHNVKLSDGKTTVFDDSLESKEVFESMMARMGISVVEYSELSAENLKI